jgi:hypothetical protein
MTRTVTRLFDTYADAELAIQELERAGVPHAEISIIANNSNRLHDQRVAGDDRSFAATDNKAADGAGKGASAGGVIGGVGGLLAGLGMLAIPGIGPVVAAGWLASTAVGAVAGAAVGGAAGGLIGAMTKAGVPEEDAHVYAEGVRRGGTLVSVRSPDDQADRVEALLNQYNGVDARHRGTVYREAGWSRFDEADTAAPRTF